ncbi:MAG: hypothetical protein EKK57_04845 [Proteobacteria bacterium]|nr:MAG: hypothetical protein EKK57_04845 [Pseudomonadota bacterium]
MMKMNFIPEPKQIYIAYSHNDTMIIHQILGWVGQSPVICVRNELIRLNIAESSNLYFVNREDMERFVKLMATDYRIISDLNFS